MPPVRPYQNFAPTVGFMPSVFLVCLLVKGLLDGPVRPGLAAAGVQIVGPMIVICIWGIWILSTRPGPPRVRAVDVPMALAPITPTFVGNFLGGLVL